jgi:hypothetical protein
MPFDGTALSQVTRDLIAARELLIEKGWVPGPGKGPEGPNCLATAIWVVTGYWDSKSGDNASSCFYTRTGPALDTISKFKKEFVWFNDSQRSIEPILELFDRAIAKSLGEST